jgi:hypothetical protein
MNSIILIIFLLINTHAFANNKEITGVVKNQKAEALAKVDIYCGEIAAPASNQQGEFSLAIYPNKKNIIYFVKEGYKPIVKILDYDNATAPLEIIMEVSSEPIISLCQNRPGFNKEKPIDIFTDNLQIAAASSLSPKIKHVGKYASYTIYYKLNEQTFILSGATGPGVTKGFPYEEWILDSTELTIDSFKYKNRDGKDVVGLDLRGKFNNGKYWRYISNFAEIIAEYHNAPDNVSAYFDTIIKGLCSKK